MRWTLKAYCVVGLCWSLCWSTRTNDLNMTHNIVNFQCPVFGIANRIIRRYFVHALSMKSLLIKFATIYLFLRDPHNILSRNREIFSVNGNVIFPNQECSKTIYLFGVHYHFKSIAAEWRKKRHTDIQRPNLSYKNNLLGMFCRPLLPSNLWFSDRLLRILVFSMNSVCCFESYVRI